MGGRWYLIAELMQADGIYVADLVPENTVNFYF